jgi:hypothetical protein
MMDAALSYSRARMVALGRTEWEDPDFSSIPKQRLSTSFHVTPGESRTLAVHNDNIDVECPVTVRVPYAPNRKPTNLADSAIAFGKSVVTTFLNPATRLTDSGIKNVRFGSMEIEPLSDSNDNGVIVKLEFIALVILSTR